MQIYKPTFWKNLVKKSLYKADNPLVAHFPNYRNSHLGSVCSRKSSIFLSPPFFTSGLAAASLPKRFPPAPVCTQLLSKVPRIVCVQASVCLKPQEAKGKEGELRISEGKSFLIASSVPGHLGPVSIFKKAEYSNKSLFNVKSNYIK